jgi:hypothetical protein
MKRLFFVFLILLLFPLNVHAACTGGGTSCTKVGTIYTCTDASYGCINDAVTAATAGDTINISATGSIEWGTTLTMSKNISLVGPGYANLTLSTTGGIKFITAAGVGSGWRVSGFTFYYNSGLPAGCGGTPSHCIIMVTGATNGWRIDHNYFNSTWSKESLNFGISTTDGNIGYGVIDGNKFNNVSLMQDANNSADDKGLSSWSSVTPIGTANANFIENNTWYMDEGSSNAIDHEFGGRSVIRYNTFYDAYIEMHSSNVKMYATRSAEVYNNVFRMAEDYPFASPITYRGGTLVYTGNLVTGNWNNEDGTRKGSVKVDNVRSASDPGVPMNACDGSQAYDSNVNPNPASGVKDGYICVGQPGAGGIVGGVPTSEPAYIWGNTAGRSCTMPSAGGVERWKVCTTDDECNTDGGSGSCCPGTGAECYPQSVTSIAANLMKRINDTGNTPYHIVAGRDYFDDGTGSNTKTGWVAYTCPHPSTGLTSFCNSTAGTAGYNVGGSVTLNGTGSFTVGGSGVLTFGP